MNKPKYVSEIDSSNWVLRWAYVGLDQFDKIEKMTIDTLDEFNELCKYASLNNGWQHRINSDYRRGGTGQHPKGRAIDVVFYLRSPGDVDVISQFLFALRFQFTGVGFYPYWKAPGIHVDTRQNVKYRAMWYQEKDNSYKTPDEYFIQIAKADSMPFSL